MTGKQVMGTAFVGATLIDGTGAPPLADAVVVVGDGRIERIGSASELNLTGDRRLIDVTGKYLIPGLLDASVHLPSFQPEVLLRYDPGCYHDLMLEAAIERELAPMDALDV